MSDADDLGLPKFHSTDPIQMVDAELMPYLQNFLIEKQRPQLPFFLFQQPGGGSWARFPITKEMFDDRDRLYDTIQRFTEVIQPPAVVLYSFSGMFIGKESRKEELDRYLAANPRAGVDELKRKGFGAVWDCLFVRMETIEGKESQWVQPFHREPIRLHNFRREVDGQTNFTGRCHFYRHMVEQDPGLPLSKEAL